MKQTSILISLLFVLLSACHEKTIGYLIAENAKYTIDTMIVRKTLDPVKDALRIKNNSPWVTLTMDNYEGTAPILFSVELVTSDQGEDAAAIFANELSIRGGGALEYLLDGKATPGRYMVSVRLTNAGYSQVVKDAYTFIIVE